MHVQLEIKHQQLNALVLFCVLYFTPFLCSFALLA